MTKPSYDCEVVLTGGTEVQMTSFDPYGLCGRDFHPTKADIGFTGIIAGNVVETEDGETIVNAPAGTRAALIVYTVRTLYSTKKLELAAHEITPLACR